MNEFTQLGEIVQQIGEVFEQDSLEIFLRILLRLGEAMVERLLKRGKLAAAKPMRKPSVGSALRRWRVLRMARRYIYPAIAYLRAKRRMLRRMGATRSSFLSKRISELRAAALLRRVAQPAQEEDRAARLVHDREQERPLGTE